MKKFIRVHWSAYKDLNWIEKLLGRIPIIRLIFTHRVFIQVVGKSEKDEPLFGIHYDLMIPDTPVLYLQCLLPEDIDANSNFHHLELLVKDNDHLVSDSVCYYASSDMHDWINLTAHLFPVELAPKC